MTIKEVNKMVKEKRYRISVMEEGTFEGIYKGWVNDEEWVDFVIFWEDGKSSGTMVLAYEIETIEEVKENV
jgi:hypothetical protein